MRWIAVALVFVVLGTAGLVWANRGSPPPRVDTRDLLISVVDGPAHDQHVDLDSRLYLPAPERLPAPAVMVAHGFGATKDSVDSDARELAQRGFVVLTWTARGFGRSGGEIALNAPDYEVYDAKQLVDWLAQRPEVVKDGPGDPRVGVTGSSYGGALSLMLAGSDPRVDTLVPVITYNDLSQALLPNSATPGPGADTPAANAFTDDGVFKRSWAGIFFSSPPTRTPRPPPAAPRRSTRRRRPSRARAPARAPSSAAATRAGGSGRRSAWPTPKWPRPAGPISGWSTYSVRSPR
jgi:ABC-2 type transport system ATP-binding protein